jgi:hypothetical protein
MAKLTSKVPLAIPLSPSPYSLIHNQLRPYRVLRSATALAVATNHLATSKAVALLKT